MSSTYKVHKYASACVLIVKQDTPFYHLRYICLFSRSLQFLEGWKLATATKGSRQLLSTTALLSIHLLPLFPITRSFEKKTCDGNLTNDRDDAGEQ